MKKTRNKWKKAFRLLIWSAFGLFLAVFASDRLISHFSSDHLYDDISLIPHRHAGLVLGTSKYTSRGTINIFFKYRIEAAARLYREKKIDYIIVSGDNHTRYYNEPKLMKEALLAKGIPESRIFLDYAGFRTLDSVVRGREIFGQGGYTVISQQFHNERAVFIARHKDIDAIAYNARDAHPDKAMNVRIREKLARVKTMLDLYILHKQPKFLGEQVEIPA